MQRHFRSLFLLLFALAPVSQAAEFCVSTPQEFQDALYEASTNGQDDHIKVHRGHYDVSTIVNGLFGGTLTYVGYYDPASDLRVSGRWLPNLKQGCAAQSSVSTTLTGDALDPFGHSVGPLLTILTGESGNVEVESLYFYDHHSVNNWYVQDPPTCGGGLLIEEWETQHTGSIKVHHNRFVLNEADEGAGLCIRGPHSVSVDVSNNLFMDNYAHNYSGAARINTYDTDKVTIVNNTVLDNGAKWWNGGISLWGEAEVVWVTNNILWGNTYPSVKFGGSEETTIFMYNDYDSMSGFPAFSGENMQVQPEFKNCGWFCFYHKELDPASPLVNAGLVPVSYWQTPSKDVAYKTRVVGSGIDIGAYETQNR